MTDNEKLIIYHKTKENKLMHRIINALPTVLASIGAVAIYAAYLMLEVDTITCRQFWIICITAFVLCTPAIVREERKG
jgi:FtsH-binding integral membrane protein